MSQNRPIFIEMGAHMRNGLNVVGTAALAEGNFNDNNMTMKAPHGHGADLQTPMDGHGFLFDKPAHASTPEDNKEHTEFEAVGTQRGCHCIFNLIRWPHWHENQIH